MHLAPRRAIGLFAVFLFVPLTGPTEAQTRAVNDQAHRFATRKSSGQLLAALRHVRLQRGKPVAQLTEAGHSDVQPPGGPVVLHVTRRLPHAPAEQPVERVDQLDIGSRVGRLATGDATGTRDRVDELRLQVAVRNIQADHPAFFQALVIRVSVRYPVPGLLPFAWFALLLSGLVWHYLDTLYSSSRTSTQVAPSLQYPPSEQSPVEAGLLRAKFVN